MSSRNTASDILLFSQDKSLVEELIEKEIKRIRRVRKTIGWENLQKEDIHQEAETALLLGVHRALVNRFLSENNISHEWVLEQRRAEDTPSISGGDRTWDMVILRRRFPEFENYYPADPLTREEVLECARKEFYDLLCSYGTDYREARRANENVNDQSPKKKKKGEVYIDLSPDTQITHLLNLEDLSDDDVLGPGITYLAMRAIDMLGPRLGIYYIFEKVFFQGKHTALLRALGGEEAAKMTPQEFEAAKRDLHRKLNEVEDFHELMRNDPELKDLFEKLKIGKPHNLVR